MRLGPGGSVAQPLRQWRGALRWRSLRRSVGAGHWVLWVCALLGGRAFGLSGVAAFALCWPLAGWWEEGPLTGWAWGAVLAAALGANWAAAARPAVAVGLFGAGLLLVRRVWRPRGPLGWAPVAAAAGLVSLLARPGLSWFPAAALALAQAALLPLALLAARCLLSSWPPARRGGAAALLQPLPALGAAVGAGVCAAGFAGPAGWPVDPRALALTAAWLWLWPPGEGALSAAAGAVAAWVAVVSGGVGAAAPASLALGGALAWALGGVRRWAPGAGLATGALLAGALAGRGGAWCWGVALSGAVWAVFGAGRAEPRPESPPPRSAPPLPAASIGWMERLRASARACLELSRGLAQVAPTGTEAPPPEHEGLRVAEEVCPGCPSLRACWERRLPRARGMVEALWSAAAAGGAHWQQVGGPDTIYCLRPRDMADVANRHAALARQREELSRLLAASRRSAVAPLLGIGRTLGELADEAAAAAVPGERGTTAAQPPRVFQARWHAAASGDECWGYSAVATAVAKPGRAVSGDAFRCRLLPGERLALLLCDGMGSGPLAAIASSAAAEHVLAWLAAGRGPMDALRLGNERLLEDGDAERFATIDLAVVHLRGALVECFKMGAPPSFLCHARGVREFPGGGLPAGILPHPEIRCSRARLRPGDVLALVSDGVLEHPAADPQAGRGGHGVADYLRAEARDAASGGMDPEALSGRMVESAMRRVPGDHDDLTALVTVLLGPARGIGRDGHDAATTAGAGPPRGA